MQETTTTIRPTRQNKKMHGDWMANQLDFSGFPAPEEFFDKS